MAQAEEQNERKHGVVQRAVDTLPTHVRTPDVAEQLGFVYDQVRGARDTIYDEARTADRGVPPHQVRDAFRQVVDEAQQG